MQTKVKTLGEMEVGDRVVKSGYLPRYPKRPIHVIASIDRDETYTEYTFTNEGDNHAPMRGIGRNYVECEVIAK